MKHSLLPRLLAIVLASLTILSCVACATPSDDPTDTSASTDNGPAQTDEEGETKFDPQIPQKNYGKDFNLIIGGAFEKDIIIVEEDEKTGDELNTVVYERGIKVEDHLGVTLQWLDGGTWTEYSHNVVNSVQSGDDDYQLVLTHAYEGVVNLITSNALYDFADFDTINLNAPYWSSELMENIRIGDKYLMGYNDMCLSSVFLITFNKELQENFKVELPYDLVRNKQWTLPKMIELASQVYKDDGNGERDAKDIYGISGWGWVPLVSMVTAADIRIVDRNEIGNYEVAYGHKNERMLSLIEQVEAMYDADWSWFWPSTGGEGPDFKSGNSLFQLFASTSLSSFRDSDLRFGVLPYPMYDENQENYRTLSWNGVMTVPNVIGDPDMVGEVLELLAYYSEPVTYAYYEKLLSAKLADAPDDVEMLNIIWDTQVTDMGVLLCNSVGDAIVYLLPTICESNAKYTSTMNTVANRSNRSLDIIFDQ